MTEINAFLFHTLIGQTLIGYILMFTIPTMIPLSFVKLVGLKGIRNILTYEAKDTILHRLDPRIKVLYPVTMGVLSIFLNWSWVYGLFALTIIPWIMLRPTLTRLRILIVLTIVPALGSVWSQGMFYTDPHEQMIFAFPWTLSWMGTPGLSLYGLQFGLQQGGRFLVTISAALLLIFTTETSDIVWACMKMKLPLKLGFALSAALRFLPLMFARVTILLQAVEIRGYDFSLPKHWWKVWEIADYLKRVVVALPLITIPLLINSLRETDIMAMVADARAFGAYKERGTLKVHTTTLEDKFGWAVYALLIATVAVLVVSGIAPRSIG
jgi:energy-coupling factor transport system permease protein